ncbi:hypothetical protein D3C73_1459440 [compost metagenome]
MDIDIGSNKFIDIAIVEPFFLQQLHFIFNKLIEVKRWFGSIFLIVPFTSLRSNVQMRDDTAHFVHLLAVSPDIK